MSERTNILIKIIRDEVIHYANLAYDTDDLKKETEYELIHKALKKLEKKVICKIEGLSSNQRCNNSTSNKT